MTRVTTAAPFSTAPDTLVALASQALLAQQPVRLSLPPDWQRPRNFPLPINARVAGPVREYRPLAVLDWVHDELAGVHASAAARERAEKRAEKGRALSDEELADCGLLSEIAPGEVQEGATT